LVVHSEVGEVREDGWWFREVGEVREDGWWFTGRSGRSGRTVGGSQEVGEIREDG
jgi:hypothetical protein